MKQFKRYSIIWVAYNEEYTLEASFLAALKAIKFYQDRVGQKILVRVVICHNGCTDKTSDVAESIKQKYENDLLGIDVILSKKGMVIAQDASIGYIRRQKEYNKSPVIFIDADTLIQKNAIYVFLEQFRKHLKLKAVGAQPTPIPYRGWRLDKTLLDKVLNCRSYFPMAEIAVNFAPEYHPYAEKDPQEIGADFEKRSKIYFHGRCFALREPNLWDVPQNRIGEDTYLDRSIHYRFGPGSIRHIYDTHVYFRPLMNLVDFSKTYLRIYRDLITLKSKYPKFKKVREFSKTKLDWGYIRTLPLRWRFVFAVYFVLRKANHILFKYGLIYRSSRTSTTWSYPTKPEIN